MDYISIGILLLSSIHFNKEYFYAQWFIGTIITSLFVAFFIGKKTSAFLGVFIAYICIYFAYISYFTNSAYSKMSDIDRINYIVASSFTLVSLLLIIISLITIKKSFLESLLKAFPVYGLINSIIVCTSWFIGASPVGNSGYSGFIQNPSINASLISYSIIYTICTKANLKHKAILLIPCLCAILLSRSSIAYGVLAVGLTTYWFMENGFKGGRINKKVLIAAPFVFIFVVLIGYPIEGEYLFNTSDRLDAYSAFLSYWWVNYDNLFGAGPGSFFILSQNISKAMSLLPERGGVWYWPWLHSDPLQELFQTGWLGFSIIVLAFLELSIRLFIRKEGKLLALFFAVVSSGIFNYPARHFPTAFVGAVIIASCYRALIEE